jgi:outer membrane lipoprotein carrier protein
MLRPSKLILLYVLAWPFTVCADPEKKLAVLLESLGSMQAQFEQTTQNSHGDVINASKGNLVLKKGGFFRIETTEPFPQLLVADGTNFYTFDQDLEQVIARRLVRDVKQIPILLFGSADQSFLQDYHITEVDEKTHTQFRLESRTPEGIFEMLILKFMRHKPSDMEIRDSLGQSTRVKLTSVTANTVIDDSLFTFTIPEGVDLIDDR